MESWAGFTRFPPVVLLSVCSLAEGRTHGALLGLEPVSGRKVNSWGSALPLCSLEQAEGVPGV